MKKLLMLGLVFLLLLLTQCVLEGSIYILAIKDDKTFEGFAKLIESIVRYSGYRFVLTVIPYLLLTSLLSKLIVKKTIFYFGAINLIANFLIVGFIGFYLESFLFDEKLFFVTLIVGVVIMICVIILRPPFIHKIISNYS